jgi:archaellum biogenesis ATPase FlaH
MSETHPTDAEHLAIEEYLDWLDREFGLETWSRADGGRHAPTDLAPFLTGESEPPEMLLAGWLVRGVLHLMYSDAEAGKTWLALGMALDVMRAGYRVVWMDEELGPRDIADRLRALGATADDISQRFVYFDFPSWTMESEDVRSWRALLQTLQADAATPLGLVIIDTVTDALAANGLDENSGVQVTSWIKNFPEVATDYGVTTLLLDHTVKSGEITRHAVGSRAKRAKAKVQYGLTSKKPYDRNRLGVIRVELTKNTLGATIDRVREYTAGGDGSGQFILRPKTAIEALLQDDTAGDDTADPLEVRLLDRLRDEGPQTTSQLRAAVVGKNEIITQTLSRMAQDGKLRAKPQGRGTVFEFIVPEPGDVATVDNDSEEGKEHDDDQHPRQPQHS